MPARSAWWTARNSLEARLAAEARTVARSNVGDRKSGSSSPFTNTMGESACLREERRRLMRVVKKGCEELRVASVDNLERPVSTAAGRALEC